MISGQETGESITGINLMDTNKEVVILNKNISDLYSSYYVFDTEESACNFDSAKFLADKEILLGMVAENKN